MPGRPTISGGAFSEMPQATLEERKVPAGAILLGERNDHAIIGEACRQPRGVEAEEGGEGVGRAVLDSARLEQELGEADGVRAHGGVERALRVTAVIALVEKQIERLLDRGLSSAHVT